MVCVPVTILGGLPVIAEVWFSGPDYFWEYDSGVDELFWVKRDGSKGAPVSQKVIDKLEKYDSYWEASVTEQANDWLSMSCPTTYSNGETIGDWSEEYILLNGDPRKRASVEDPNKQLC